MVITNMHSATKGSASWLLSHSPSLAICQSASVNDAPDHIPRDRTRRCVHMPRWLERDSRAPPNRHQ